MRVYLILALQRALYHFFAEAGDRLTDKGGEDMWYC